MNATATQSFKFRISQRMVWMMVLSAVFLYSLYVALAEQNGMAALGCITTIVCVIFVLDVGQKLHGRVPLLDKKNRVELYFVVLMLPYSCVASFVHLASDYKVWIANGKTTLNHDFLVRMPLAPLAKSVNVNQNKTYEYSAKTKDGYLVSATISGTFRLTESEGEIVSTFSSMEESPDRVIAMALNQVHHVVNWTTRHSPKLAQMSGQIFNCWPFLGRALVLVNVYFRDKPCAHRLIGREQLFHMHAAYVHYRHDATERLYAKLLTFTEVEWREPIRLLIL